MKLSPNEYSALLRSNFLTFIERSFRELNPATPFLSNWHIEVIAAELEKCRRGETKRLIINVPPRSLKSHCASIAFPAWLLGHDPSCQIIAASYAQDLANKLSSDCRTLLTSSFYQELFPTRLSPRRQAVQEFVTTRQGFRLATSIGGVLTGRGADILIIDDPQKPDEALSDTTRKAVNDWFTSTLYSRLNSQKDGCIILIMQRLHEDDLVGHVVALEPWKVLQFPAIAEKDEVYVIDTPYGTRRFERRAGEALHPGRQPIHLLNHRREVLSEGTFSAQYQQSPTPPGGALVRVEWFPTYTEADLPANFEMILLSVDTASTPSELGDYSVGTIWGIEGVHIYLINVFRERLAYPELKCAVRELAEAFRPHVILIENQSSGIALIQELRSEGMHAIQPYETSMKNKTMRMNSVTPMMKNGFVHLPDKGPWLPDYLHEMMAFPNGKHDDQADSTSQALDWFKQHCMNPKGPWLECLRLDDDSSGWIRIPSFGRS